MKRTGNLFEQIVDRDNLRLAYSRALRGKRARRDAQQFAQRLDQNLEEMAEQVAAGTYPLGRYQQFIIHDPKERIITAPCFAERVLHHGIMNVCEPILDRWLIDDTFACRPGRGRIAALQRAQSFARRFAYFLKLDVRKYFDSIPHDRLLARLARRFKDRRLLELLAGIVGAFRGSRGRGLPIGSLTSQHFANCYLGGLDRLIKEELRIKGYVRYMDDLALWSDARSCLRSALATVEAYVRGELGLELKPSPYLNRTAHGMDFLGCRLYRQHLVLSRRSRRRFRRKLIRLERLFAAGFLDAAQLQQRATALVAFARSAGVSSWRFRTRVLQELAVSGPRARTG
jgi:retron-type reverse transcriptase